ncbi:hypothetical protein [Enterococcus canintestini]|uniref:Uncharacterized protein n=1 Tax=Enterococcus canintestini TaxID=317010 RepID=A0A267HQ66_9ENTE|nr:hypothetical protein [Enterococcus canintestini]PAB00476.1 hypothetical protein AKL21_08270 [Enterococcus canintestini]
MSIGFYFATDSKINLEENTECSGMISINDIMKFANADNLISDFVKNMEIDLSNIDKDDKIFTIIEDEKKAQPFNVIKDSGDGIISKYTAKKNIYYLDLYSWNFFYDRLSEFLIRSSDSFELWMIWEDKYEIEDLVTVKLKYLDSNYLEKVYGKNEYLNPIVGISSGISL